MLKKKTFAIILVVFILIIFCMIVAHKKSNDPLREDEIQLQIKLNLKEDIGLLIFDYSIDDAKGSGGISNANKTLLKHDELLYHRFDKKSYTKKQEEVTVTIKFRIITKYIDPNYENIYPKKYTKPMNEIIFPAQYGNSYSIIITGDKTNGYKARFSK